MPGPTACAAPAAGRVLVFTRTVQFRHDAILTTIATLQRVAAAEGMQADATEAADFTPVRLARYRVVVFANTTGDVLDAAQQRALEGFIRAGGGFAGLHAAADTEYDWPWYGARVGAYFRAHPPGLQDTRVQPERDGRTRGTAWPIRGEIYTCRDNPRARARGRHGGRTSLRWRWMGDDHPITWCHTFDGGHSWYTGLGHDEAVYRDPDFVAQLRQGLRYAAGSSSRC